MRSYKSVYTCTRNNGRGLLVNIIIAVFLAKISPMLRFNENRVYFFYFVTWISMIFWTVLVVFTTILVRKSWKPKWYSWSAKKKKLKPLGHPAGLEGRSGALRAPLRPSSPAGWPSGFNLFLFCTSWNHFGFKISDQNRRETTKTIQKNHWNQVTKKKKTRFLFNTCQSKSYYRNDSWISTTLKHSTPEFGWHCNFDKWQFTFRPKNFWLSEFVYIPIFSRILDISWHLKILHV